MKLPEDVVSYLCIVAWEPDGIAYDLLKKYEPDLITEFEGKPVKTPNNQYVAIDLPSGETVYAVKCEHGFINTHWVKDPVFGSCGEGEWCLHSGRTKSKNGRNQMVLGWPKEEDEK